MLMTREKPDIIMLQETKLEDCNDPTFSSLWRHPWYFDAIPSVGRSGGIIMAWNSDVVEVLNVKKG
ncbi:hypothetical protein FRX31_027912, partial [Thalictrum thalictroides]